nr:DUF192 domain-containing protein [Luteibacter sp. Sphag1AF]
MRALAFCALGLPFAAFGANAPSVTLHGRTFSTEFATDDASREHGLMDRKHLAPDHGMLFVFPDDEPRSFWMKNTLIPLDILYFDGSRRLVSMQLNVPPCQADPCAVYPSTGNARYVLELAAGTASGLALKPGDTFTIEGEPGVIR